MKLIHSADWHLGQTFFEYNRIDEQRMFLDWLRAQMVQQQVQLLCIAGDVFDVQNPSSEAQKLYYEFLLAVNRELPTVQIVIIAGNHDSAQRLEAPRAILSTLNVHVIGVFERNEHGEIDFSKLVIPVAENCVCVAVPYVRQGDYNSSLNYGDAITHIITQACDYARQKFPQSKIIVLGHLYASGAEISENDNSERLMIGGIDVVNTNNFPKEISYCALGHLHKAQRVGANHIRYSGSPLPMSFAEINYNHGVNLVEITADDVNIERLNFSPPAELLLVPKKPAPLLEVLDELRNLPDAGDEGITCHTPYLYVQVKISEPQPNLRSDIEQAIVGKNVRFVGFKKIEPVNEEVSQKLSYNQTKQMTPLEIAETIYSRKYQESIPPELHKLLQQAITSVEEE